MSGILHKIAHFIKELNHFSRRSSATIQFEQLCDRLNLSALTKQLTMASQYKETDLDVTYSEAKALQKIAQLNFYHEDIKNIAEEIGTYFDEVLKERDLQLKSLLTFIHDCKVVSDVSCLDVSKMNIKSLIPICKKMFSLEHAKADDVLTFCHRTDLKRLYVILYQEDYFSQETLQSQITFQNEQIEQQAAAYNRASKNIRISISTGLTVRLAALQGRATMVPSSAPTSPIHKEAAPMTRMRALSAPRLKIAKDDYSTSSTIVLENQKKEQDIVTSFGELKLAPSSRSEDESDEKRQERMNKRFKKD